MPTHADPGSRVWIIPADWARFQSATPPPASGVRKCYDDDISACRLVSARPSSSRAATGHPAVADRPSLVSRYTDLYGDEFLARYRRINVANRAELERTLSEYRITWTIFPAGHPIVSVMDERAGWRRLVGRDCDPSSGGSLVAVGVVTRRRRVAKAT
jgi:hypothetical protein